MKMMNVEINWHLVSEGLPDKDGRYLVTVGHDKYASIELYCFSKNLYEVDEYDFKHRKRPGWYIETPFYNLEMTGVSAWADVKPYSHNLFCNEDDGNDDEDN